MTAIRAVAPNQKTDAAGSNFYYAFIFLPKNKRQAIKTVYEFCRIVDDLVDETPGKGDPFAGLDMWREEIEACYQGLPATPIGDRLTDAIEEFDIPKQPFVDLIDGMRMDLEYSSYQTFADLREYCYRVASAVGLICIEIFGYESLRTREYAVNLGLALQLTNILRDLKEDVRRGRIYIPVEDLERFGYSQDNVRQNVYNTPFIDLMKFEHSRARSYFLRAAGALPDEDRASLFAAEIMADIYHRLLDQIAAVKFDVFRNQISVPKKERLKLAVNFWLKSRLTAWGWAGK
ncbi:MAG TPA: presqualene diphosphate synthase HpnD [Blastocatellia bacterium]|nr:presqualene diphosphate synthase HpnD [Blastocatellia bacterium]